MNSKKQTSSRWILSTSFTIVTLFVSFILILTSIKFLPFFSPFVQSVILKIDSTLNLIIFLSGELVFWIIFAYRRLVQVLDDLFYWYQLKSRFGTVRKLRYVQLWYLSRFIAIQLSVQVSDHIFYLFGKMFKILNYEHKNIAEHTRLYFFGQWVC